MINLKLNSEIIMTQVNMLSVTELASLTKEYLLHDSNYHSTSGGTHSSHNRSGFL